MIRSYSFTSSAKRNFKVPIAFVEAGLFDDFADAAVAFETDLALADARELHDSYVTRD